MELIDIARLINPFAYGNQFENEIYFLINAIIEGDLPVFLYPWQNKYFIFADDCKPNLKDNNRLHFADINIDYQGYALIHISDYESASLKYHKTIPFDGSANVWRSYIDHYINKKPSLEALHPGNTKPIIKTREKLKVLCECHDSNLSIGEILKKCKQINPDLFSNYELDTFSKGKGNLWQLAQGYNLIPKRKLKNPT